MHSESEPQFPAWIALAWLAAMLALWPVAKHFLQTRNPVPTDDLVRAQLDFRKGDDAGTIEAATRYLKSSRDSAAAWIDIAAAYGRMGKWEQGIEASHQAIILEPNNQLAWNDLRWMLQSQLDAHPTPEAHETAAVIAYQAQNYSSCITETKKAIELYRQYAKAWNLLAVCDARLHDYDEAITAFGEALRIEPTFELAKNNLAATLREKASASPPASAPSTAVKPAPPAAAPLPSGQVIALINSSLAHYRAKQMQGCIDDAGKALKLSPNLAVAYNNIAACSNDLGRYDEAIAAAQKAIQLQPGFQLAINNLAVAVNLKRAQLPRK